jgi:hypothetical protein
MGAWERRNGGTFLFLRGFYMRMIEEAATVTAGRNDEKG